MLYKMQVGRHGTGMFAVSAAIEGERIAQNCYRLFREPRDALRHISIYEYCFIRENDRVAVVLGDISLVNHASPARANARLEWNTEGRIVTLIADRAIQVGEEVRITYVNPEDYECLED